MAGTTLEPKPPRLRSRLGRGQIASLVGMASVVVGLNVVGWGTLLGFVVPGGYHVGTGQVFGIGLGVTAFTLGMRHAFDADHIAAIDNTTRKLMQEGQQPLSVGFYFSLGHSSIVFALCLLLAFGVRALAGQVGRDSSSLQQVTGMIGTTVSGVFLMLIGILNLVVLVRIVKVFRQMRTGGLDEQALEEQLSKRGFLNRILGGVTKAVRKPWHMYPVGLLFGLGFDTATEVSLLVLAGGAAAFELPWYAILVLPVLFAAGMSLLDSLDGTFMNFAYGWAFSKPVRKVYYNMTVTALSVAVALIIGSIEIISIISEKAGIAHGPLAVIAHLDLNYVGFVIVGLFVVTWLVALGVYRAAKVEEKWTARLADAPGTD